ncbi:hypothetical protein SEA_WISHMAKER_41 [Mycobacterium phage Wishmaker]|uniref:CDGP domain-containing protein n=10 Tax=Caudoviricetes TaxID=2731619 RepID=A0A514A6C0_9CAUD|nr:hypothetical protein SEA_DEEPSOIL15_43 [Mycobacterium phage DeepSoil15]
MTGPPRAGYRSTTPTANSLAGQGDPHDRTTPMHPTKHRAMRSILNSAITVATAVVATATFALSGATAPVARADGGTPDVGCETIHWGFFGSQWRTICDGPKRADGSWLRARRVWTPAGYVRGSTYCSRYSCSSSAGYYREESTQRFEEYVVFDHNVLPDEPAWMPPGTYRVL